MSDPPWRHSESEDTAPLGGMTSFAERADEPPAEQHETDTTRAKKKTKKKKKRNYVAVAAQALIDGERETTVRAWLEQKGLGPDAIDEIVARARARIREQVEEHETAHEAAYEEATRARRRQDVLHGALWFGGGLLLTVGTCSAAQDAGGGSYVLAWGPMLYGGYRLLKGL